MLLPRLVREAATHGLSGLEFAEGIPGSVGGGLRMNAGAGGRWMGDVVREVLVVTPTGSLERRTTGPGDFGYRRSFIAAGDLVAVEAVFEGTPDDPEAIRERMRDSRAYRVSTQPLSERSSGCIFRNPEGGSAGEILDRLGLKGLSVGGAVVSDIHANFIVNHGGTAADVLALAERVRDDVLAQLGVRLQFEVVIWRDDE
jgi:UDP-N-acetylmuramate dehydrogenase